MSDTTTHPRETGRDEQEDRIREQFILEQLETIEIMLDARTERARLALND